MKKFRINLGSEEIEYYILRKKVKNISIKIKADLFVEVVANNKISENYIETLLLKKSSWILKTMNKVRNRNIKPKIQYISGDIIYYLGDTYELEVILDKKEKVSIIDKKIYIYTKDIYNFERKEKIMYNWYREEALRHFLKLLDEIYPLIENYNINKPDLKIRKMKSCWGTCHYLKDVIVLNTELIKYHSSAIEYVIVHELAHFVHHNHSKEFYGLLDILMPDWRERKSLLK